MFHAWIFFGRYDKVSFMDRLSLDASERELLGKKVKRLRIEGKLPAHVFGKGIDTEHISVDYKSFLSIFKKVGSTILVDLRIGQAKSKPVLIRSIQADPLTGKLLHIDFYQVNLKVKVKVPVPIELVGEEPEKVHLGEAIVLQTLNEVEVEALPADFIEKIEVNIEFLKEIDDAITVEQLNYDKEKLIVNADPGEIVVKLAPAVTAEMEALLEEQAAEAAEVLAEAAAEEIPSGEAAEVGEGETESEGEALVEGVEVSEPKS